MDLMDLRLPFTPFTAARFFVHGADDFEETVGRGRAPLATCCRCCRRHRHQPCNNTMAEESHYLEVCKGVQFVGKGAVLELRLAIM